MTVSGSFVVGGAITYEVTITNAGVSVQPNNPGDEFEDTLPATLDLVSASATSGTATVDVGARKATWNGTIGPGASVTITIDATVSLTTSVGVKVSNQGIVRYDSDAAGNTNDSSVLTDDPGRPGAVDSTDFNVITPAMSFFTLAPCRLLDTRDPDGTFGGPALSPGGPDRVFPVAGRCGIPSTARAIAVNIAVTQTGANGHLRLFAAEGVSPAVSINYSAGQTRTNNAIVPLNGLGELAVRCVQAGGTTDFILDVTGYFE
jgi:uncharacterized repeat protein (TIGR01451 family)